MIKVEISKEARDYILKTSDTINVDMLMYSGWGGVVNEPAVSAGKPYAPENFDEITVDGIKVYIFKEAVSGPDGIKISLVGDWWIFYRLQVEGLIFEQPIAG